MNRVKLKDFLMRQFYQEHDEGPCVKLVVRHIDSAGRSAKDGEVWSSKIAHSDTCVTVEEDDLDTLITEIENICFDDAEGLGGVQKYRLMSYCKFKPEPKSRYTFRFAAGDTDEDEVGLTEPATKQGLVSQMMRHCESYARINAHVSSQTISQLQRMNGKQAEHIENLLQERHEYFEMLETLKSQHHERELSTLEAASKEKRNEQIFDSARLLMPALVNRISGKKILPEATTPTEELLKNFAESLNQDQMGKILQALNPTQQLAMLEFIQSTQKEDKEDKEDSSKQPTNGSG